ncbi:MAG TPA: L,D-transpeptidase [Polyangiales bacterium]
MHLIGALLALSACRSSGGVTTTPESGENPAPATTPPSGKPPQVSEKEALQERGDLPPEGRALARVDGVERWVDAKAAEQAGYTIVDLSDSWTPLIFHEEVSPEGQPLPNRYRRVFIGLANDELDNDGEPLEPGEKNYLELYGIMPSLSVVRSRFLEDVDSACHDQESVAVLSAVETVSYVAPTDLKKEAKRLARIEADLETARKKYKFENWDDLAANKTEFADEVALLKKRAAEKPAMAAVEKRLRCEKLLTDESKHVEGIYDDAMRLAVRRFQQKHMIYEANYLRSKTVDALARPPIDNDYDSLVRALRERVISAAGIIEDGTGGTQKTPALNLVDEYTNETIKQLGLGDVQSALAFFQRHPAEEFKTLRAAVKLPKRPDYYGEHMELSIVVDRGDVWYDLPFDKDGNFKPFARKRYPMMTLMLDAGGKKIALARWRTTIGSWRAEQASDGYEYFRYKGSDVGPRVIRQIISGPVWIAPTSTPIRSLVKTKTVNGAWTKVVNYEELGPGYLSAYGVVAGYFVVPGENGRPDWDNGVRAHGSSDYLSIYSANGFSHGCHRLPNHIAIRLYSFILGHRHKRIAGDQPVNLTRQFLFNDKVYEMRIPSRGYAYYLDPPLPVNVLEGTIRGAQKKPIVGYVPKPNEVYPGPPPPAPDSPEAKAGGGGGE